MFSALAQKGFELAKDASIAPVLQEQIKLIATQLEITEKNLEEAKENNVRQKMTNEELQKELTKLREELAKFDEGTAFKDIGICYIKEDKEGNILQGFYCTSCRIYLEEDWNAYQHKCPKCNKFYDIKNIQSMFEDYKKRNATTTTP